METIQRASGPASSSVCSTWGAIEDNNLDSLQEMAKATHWETIVDLLSQNQELSLKLMIAIQQSTNPNANPKLERKRKSRISTSSLDELKKDIKEAKDTLERIGKKLQSTEAPNQKQRKPPRQSLKPKQQRNPTKEVVISGLTYSPNENLREVVTDIARERGSR